MLTTSAIASSYLYTTADTSASQSVTNGTDDTTEKTTSSLEAVSLGKDDFLKLLIAELQNQDPLNPADNTEFVAQLAQFSSLEQLSTLNTNLEESLTNSQTIAESINNSVIVNLIGKGVTAESNEFKMDGSNSVQLTFELDSDITTGSLTIHDSDDLPVQVLSLDSLSMGLNSITWDGFTTLGVLAESGTYTYEVTAYDSVGSEVDVTEVSAGIVEGVTYRDGETYLDVGGLLVPFDKVTHIIEAE